MLVVPLSKDTILTSDGAKYKVLDYTNYKVIGPAVYVKIPKSKDTVLVYFADIVEINGTKVNYKSNLKLFESLGTIQRAQQLPQPGDVITVLDDRITNEEHEDRVTVSDLRLQVKSQGINKGLLVRTDDKRYFRLGQILDIDRNSLSTEFNRGEFKDLYRDYLGV